MDLRTHFFLFFSSRVERDLNCKWNISDWHAKVFSVKNKWAKEFFLQFKRHFLWKTPFTQSNGEFLNFRIRWSFVNFLKTFDIFLIFFYILFLMIRGWNWNGTVHFLWGERERNVISFKNANFSRSSNRQIQKLIPFYRCVLLRFKYYQ